MIHVYDSNRKLSNHITLSSTPPWTTGTYLSKMCIVRKVRLARNLACPLAHCYQVRRLGESLEDISLYYQFLRKKAGIMKSHEYQIWRIRDYLEENNERWNLWTVCFLNRGPAWLPSASGQGSLTMCFSTQTACLLNMCPSFNSYQ